MTDATIQTVAKSIFGKMKVGAARQLKGTRS